MYARELLGPAVVPQAVLGCGASAFVVRARDESRGRDVAAKILFAEAFDDDGRARLAREAEVGSAVEHPGLVAVLRADPTRGFLLIELIDGESLAALLAREARLDARRVARLTLQILDVLEACHRVGVVHRDVTPGNILVARDGHARLSDFGIARSVDGGLTRSGTTMGTPAYMAPEQLRRADVDGRADLYGLGATMFEAATGARLHTDARSIDEPGRWMLDATGDPWLARAIEAAVASEPGDRPATAADMRALLAPPRSARRARWAVVAVVLVVILGAIAWLSPVGRPREHTPSVAPRIAVLPFLERTGLPELSMFAVDLPFLVAIRLAGREEEGVLGYYELLRRVRTASAPAAAWREAASAAGASYVVVGRTDTSTVVGRVLVEVTVEGPGGEIFERLESHVAPGEVVDVVLRWVPQLAMRIDHRPLGQPTEELRAEGGLALARGRAALERQEFMLALDELQHAVRLDPSSSDAWFYLAVAAWWHDLAPREVESIIDTAEKFPRTRARAALLEGIRLLVRGDYERAVTLLAPMSAELPSDPYLSYGLGEALFHAGRPDEGVAAIARAIELAPSQQLGMLHVLDVAIVRRDDARLEWGLARLSPTSMWSDVWRARLWIAQGKIDAARELLYAVAARGHDPAEQLAMVEMLAPLEVYTGRPRLAELIVDQVEARVAVRLGMAEVRCAIHLAEGEPTDACAAAMVKLATSERHDVAMAHTEAVRLGEVLLFEGDEATLEAIDRALERLSTDRRPVGRAATLRLLLGLRLGRPTVKGASTHPMNRALELAIDAERAGRWGEAAERWASARSVSSEASLSFALAVLEARAAQHAGQHERARRACGEVRTPYALTTGWLGAIGTCTAITAQAARAMGDQRAANESLAHLRALRRHATPGDALIAAAER